MPDIDEKQTEATAPEVTQEAVGSVQDVLDAAFPTAPDDPTVPQEEPAAEPEAEEAPAEEEAAEPVEEAKAEEEAKPELSEAEKEMADLGITKDKTRARFHELYEQAKEAERLRDVVQKSDQVFQFMEANGVTGEQFGQAVAFIGLVNSQDPVKLEQAYTVLEAELQQIARRLGREAPGYDPLSEFPEVAQRVKTGELAREDALELARLKREREAYASRAQSDAAMQRELQEAARVRDELNELGEFLKKTDPLYDQKVPILLKTLKPVLEQLPYRERANAFKQAYAAFQMPQASAPAKVVRPDPANTARPKSSAGEAVPNSTLAAIEMAVRSRSA